VEQVLDKINATLAFGFAMACIQLMCIMFAIFRVADAIRGEKK
jgi:hypothetical protein